MYTYEQALRAAYDLIEEPGTNPEYERGQINLLAELFPVPEQDIHGRMETIERDLLDLHKRQSPEVHEYVVHVERQDISPAHENWHATIYLEGQAAAPLIDRDGDSESEAITIAVVELLGNLPADFPPALIDQPES